MSAPQRNTAPRRRGSAREGRTSLLRSDASARSFLPPALVACGGGGIKRERTRREGLRRRSALAFRAAPQPSTRRSGQGGSAARFAPRRAGRAGSGGAAAPRARYIRCGLQPPAGRWATRLDQVVAVDGGRHRGARQARRHELAEAGARRGRASAPLRAAGAPEAARALHARRHAPAAPPSAPWRPAWPRGLRAGASRRASARRALPAKKRWHSQAVRPPARVAPRRTGPQLEVGDAALQARRLRVVQVAVHNLRAPRRGAASAMPDPCGLASPARRARAFSASVSGLFSRLRIICARHAPSAAADAARGRAQAVRNAPPTRLQLLVHALIVDLRVRLELAHRHAGEAGRLRRPCRQAAASLRARAGVSARAAARATPQPRALPARCASGKSRRSVMSEQVRTERRGVKRTAKCGARLAALWIAPPERHGRAGAGQAA